MRVRRLLVLFGSVTLSVAILSGCGNPPSALKTAGRLVLSNVHDRTYSNVTFDGAGIGGADSSGVISIGDNCYNLTFTNCTIDANRDHVGDGVKIVGGSDHDISFIGCHFMTQPRMGFECIGRSGSGYRRVNIIDCVFEVQGSEAISYDDDTGQAGDCTISGCLVKGGGAGTLYPWTQGLEINRVRDVTVTNSTFYACRGDIWNLSGPSGTCGWVFKDNVIDMSRRAGGITPTGDASCVASVLVYGGSFVGNRVVSAAPGGGGGWFDDCHNMDWTTTTWHDARGAPYTAPRQVDCSGNRF
jgi:hypothetical protein